MTLKELIEREAIKAAERYAERRAFLATPEGQAQEAEFLAHDARMREADRKWAEENPSDPFELGRSVRLANEAREPPEELSSTDQELWLNGWDSEHDSED